MTDLDGSGAPAGPQLIRAMNEQLVLSHLRRAGELSRTELTRRTGLSKPTVSLTVTNLERAGLVRACGMRTGTPGPAAALYEIRPDAGFVIGLDVGKQFLRGALCDLSGKQHAHLETRAAATTGQGRIEQLAELARRLRSAAGVVRSLPVQTVLGTPGVYDPQRDGLTLTGVQPGWHRSDTMSSLRAAFGPDVMVENDVNAAAMAERALGHGRDSDSFAFVSIGTGIGMGLVIDGRLRRGAHGAAGEIGFLPVEGAPGDTAQARRLGRLEASASAAGIVRAARRAGLRRSGSARAVFDAAARGDRDAVGVLADEVELVARAIASIVAIIDPPLIVLGGGIGRAEGFLGAVENALPRYAPVLPELKVSALGADAVVDGCLVAGLDQAWSRVAPDPRSTVVELAQRR